MKNRAETRCGLNFDASSILARQIEEGAPADVFLSADDAKMDALEKAGYVAPGTRKGLFSFSGHRRSVRQHIKN